MTKNIIIAIIAFAIIGFGINAIAHGPYGMGYGMGYGHMGGYGHMMDWGYGGYDNDITSDDAAKMAELRDKFMTETQSLRDGLYAKETQLRDEFAKSDPDAEKIKEIQKDISGIRTDLDNKWADHMIEMRKIVPNAGAMRYGMSRNDMGGYGGRMGYGSYCRGNY